VSGAFKNRVSPQSCRDLRRLRHPSYLDQLRNVSFGDLGIRRLNKSRSTLGSSLRRTTSRFDVGVQRHEQIPHGASLDDSISRSAIGGNVFEARWLVCRYDCPKEAATWMIPKT
jgi:hypothetical protein